MEKWEFIKGYDGRYQISNLGRVKSIWHEKSVGIGKRHKKKIISERLVAITDNGKGYKIVSLSKNGHRKNHYVHRLVAEHFIKNENNFEEVNHKDFNTSNNNVSNLEWCSRQENMFLCKGRFHPRKTNTGENYIQKRNNGTFAVVIRRKEKRFRNMSDAINYRNEILMKEGFNLERI